MISVKHLDIRYGEKHLFKNISARVHATNRIGLVGVNGAGKSTLLKIMARVNETDPGVVKCAKGFSVSYLPQEPDVLISEKSLYEEAESAFDSLLSLQTELDELHIQLAEVSPDESMFQMLMQRQGEIQQQLDHSNIYSMRSQIEKILHGLGFSADDLQAPVTSFSGGWIMRLMLAKLLLEAPSLLLLDEPTNHLDLESLTWVEAFLENYQGAMVIISHDRMFLDKITNMTWELSLGKLTAYKGNYSFYLKEKEERRRIDKAAYDNQQAMIRQTTRFVERFRAKSTKAKQVQSRVKQLEKIERIELEDDEHGIHFSFPPAPPSGRDVMQIEGVGKSFNGVTVFCDVEFQLQRGDKVAVVGVNGAGKSTLLKILDGQIKPDSGDIQYGTGVARSYFGQHQAQELSPELSVLDTISLSGEEMTITRMRSLLGAFLFRGEDVDKKVGVLSGGEKSRLALAKMIASPANCMLLDEPTNHLDMGSQEVLQEAMKQYDGTIMVVSHNRYFVDSFVNKVLEVKGGRVALYEGNVAEYLDKVAAMEKERLELEKRTALTKDRGQQSQLDPSKVLKENRKEVRKQEAIKRQERSRKIGPYQKLVVEAEEKVEKLEVQKEQLELQMADPELYQDEQAWVKTSKVYEQCKRRLERWYERWETAQIRIDEIDAEL